MILFGLSGRSSLPALTPIGRTSSNTTTSTSTTTNTLDTNHHTLTNQSTPFGSKARLTTNHSNSTTPFTNNTPNTNPRSNASPSASMAFSGRVQPLKFAVRFHPPTIAMEYRDRKYPSRQHNRLKVFSIQQCLPPSFDLTTIDITSPSSRLIVDNLVDKMSDTFPEYLSPVHVTHTQLQRLIKKALSRPNRNATSTTSSAGGYGDPSGSVSGSSSLNASYAEVDEDELEVSTGSTSFSPQQRYQRIGTTTSTTSAAPSSSSLPANPSSAASFSSSSATSKALSVTAAAVDSFHIPGADPPKPVDGDLQHVSEDELARRKEEMNAGQANEQQTRTGARVCAYVCVLSI